VLGEIVVYVLVVRVQHPGQRGFSTLARTREQKNLLPQVLVERFMQVSVHV
jgi:hypothetical protein